MTALEHPDITHILRTGYPPQVKYPEHDDIAEIAHQCSSCGTVIAEEQSTYHLCESCEEKALAQFKYLLCNEFTENERKYIDDCTEGISLTEPEKFKPIKAIY